MCTFKQGESVCAPIIENPFPGAYLPPTAKAIIADWFRVKKYFPPRDNFEIEKDKRYTSFQLVIPTT